MDTRNVTGSPAGAARRDANGVFKERSRSWFWAGLAAAVVVHFLLLALGPPMRTVLDVTRPPAEVYAIALEPPPEVPIPAPPPPVEPPPMPAMPVPVDVAHDLTITPFSFNEIAIPAELAPPPVEVGEREDGEALTPFTVAPELKNRDRIKAILLRRYPARLRNAGVEGTVVFQFWIDEQGEITQHEMMRSSGNVQLDAIAEDVIALMEFSPAFNMDRPVAVTVSLPIVFEVR